MKNIMVVDDDSTVRELIVAICQRQGHVIVCEASSGNKALRWFENNMKSVDLVITDLQMDDGDGIHLITSIKALLPSLPVIMTSGGMSQSDKVAALNAGASVVLKKPFIVAEFIKTIEQVCGDKP